jgi:hypothetical protein
MSSNKINKDSIQKEDLGKVRHLLELIENEPQAFDFLDPVDYIGIIFLSTTKKRLGFR